MKKIKWNFILCCVLLLPISLSYGQAPVSPTTHTSGTSKEKIGTFTKALNKVKEYVDPYWQIAKGARFAGVCAAHKLKVVSPYFTNHFYTILEYDPQTKSLHGTMKNYFCNAAVSYEQVGMGISPSSDIVFFNKKLGNVVLDGHIDTQLHGRFLVLFECPLLNQSTLGFGFGIHFSLQNPTQEQHQQKQASKSKKKHKRHYKKKNKHNK